MSLGKHIQENLKKIARDLAGEDVKVILQHPTTEEHGDYSTNIAMVLYPRVRDSYSSPVELAEQIRVRYREMEDPSVERIDVVAPGFVNFWLAEETLEDELGKIVSSGASNYGAGEEYSQKKFLVEFGHPNTHKLFHIGHLRNITVGEAVSRLFESQGAQVVRANYQGDVGLHVAKALYGLKNNRELMDALESTQEIYEKVKVLGQAYAYGNKLYEEDAEAKKEVQELNRQVYEKSSEIDKLWSETRSYSLEYFDTIYSRVGTKYDRLYFESEVAGRGLEIVKENLGKVFREDQSAIIFPGEEHGLHNRVFVNSLGLPTYEAKDLGLAHLQFEEYSPDEAVHVVGPEQIGYFQVLFKALELVDPQFEGKEKHLVYGWVRLKEGKMSSRTGDVVEGEWAINAAKEKLQGEYKMTDEIAEQVAVGAVKYSMLRLSPSSEIAFSVEESIRLDGESGPYIQYTYARTQSILEKAQQYGGETVEIGELNEQERDVLRMLYRFPEVVEQAAQSLSPNLLCAYLFDLAQGYNTFYNQHRIIEAEDNQKVFRLMMTKAVGDVLASGLNLLGISAPSRM